MPSLWDTGWRFVVQLAVRKLLALDRPAFFASEPDEPPPPPGYASWTNYFDERRLTQMDFLPLGAPAEGCKMSPVWTRVGEDVCTIGLHFVHANPDIAGDTVHITDANLATLEGLFDTLWDTIKPLFPESLVLDRYEWHDFGVGVRRPNPKRRETLGVGAPGTADSVDALPPQVATSVTLRTSHRKTWGRVYLPALDKAQSVSGRITGAGCITIRSAFGVMADAAAAANLPLVVWSPRHAGLALKYGEANHAAFLDDPDETSFAKSVDIVQVDDLFDVIRSRRFDTATVKETHTIGA